MKIISADGIGVRALLGAAEKLYELTEERNLVLGVIESGVEGAPVAVVTGQLLGEGPALGVTVEQNPRIVDLGVDDHPGRA
jgi:hypothetical protein